MASNIFDLFGDTSIAAREFVSTPPKNLTDMASSGSASPSGTQLKIDLINRVLPRIDYSDFNNYVFFNSALDYFNISADRLIQQYPYDGTYDDILTFQSSSDTYENYLTTDWPHFSGAISFTTSSGSPSISVSDLDAVVSSGSSMMLAPGSSSFTVEFHINILTLPPSGSSGSAYSGSAYSVITRYPSLASQGPTFNTTTPVLNSASYFIYVATNPSGTSSINLAITGTTVVSATLPTAGGYYVAAVVDRSASMANIYLSVPLSGTVSRFTNELYLASSASLPTGSVLDTGVSFLVVGSGTRSGVSGVMLSGTALSATKPDYHLAELRIWNMARSQQDLFSTYNTRVYKDDSLVLYWRFAEPYPFYTDSNNYYWFARDYSGHKMDGRVKKSNNSISPWISASAVSSDGGLGMSPQDRGEPILSARDDRVVIYATNVQTSASLYDRNNTNIITNLVPQQFLYLEEENNTQVLKNLLYLLARQFDELKCYIDQSNKILLGSYDGHNMSPDALLDEVLKFWGWSTKGNFLSKEAFQWLFGLGVLDRTPEDIQQQIWTNQKLDTQLYEIKNEFWRRTLNNLSYLYKKKGTKESVESLLRIYGLDNSFIKVKEFGMKPNVSISTTRIGSVKSATALRLSLDSGSFQVKSSASLNSALGTLTSGTYTVDMQLSFPASGSQLNKPTSLSGTIFHLSASNAEDRLYYIRSLTPGNTLTYGSLVFQSTTGSTTSSVTFPSIPIFNGYWTHLNLYRVGDVVTVNVQTLDTNRVGYSASFIGAVTGVLAGRNTSLVLAGSSSVAPMGQYWTRNVQVWNTRLTDVEITDHTLNTFSVGTDTPDRSDYLALQWNFDELVDGDPIDVTGSSLSSQYFDSGDQGNFGIMSGSTAPWKGGPTYYGRYNYQYNFIAPPDYSWSEEKIRYLDTPRQTAADHWNDINDVSIEFNLIDALNEDISTIISSMDHWNNVLGDPANKFREDYQDLVKLRQQYFARLTGRINFRAFADFMDFFDRSFLDLVKKLIPARVDFKGAELVVESHMLERPKVQFTYRPHDQILVPEGIITIYSPYNYLQVTTFASGNTP